MTIEGPGENHLQLNGECSLSSQELCRMFQLQPLDSVMSNHICPSLTKDLFTDFSNRRVPVQKYKPRRIYWPLVRRVGVPTWTRAQRPEYSWPSSQTPPPPSPSFPALRQLLTVMPSCFLISDPMICPGATLTCDVIQDICVWTTEQRRSRKSNK